MGVIEDLQELKDKYIDKQNSVTFIPCLKESKNTEDKVYALVKAIHLDEKVFRKKVISNLESARNYLIENKKSVKDTDIILEASRITINEEILKYNDRIKHTKDLAKRRIKTIHKILDMLKKGFKYVEKDKIIEYVKELKINPEKEQDLIDKLLVYIDELELKERIETNLRNKEDLLSILEETEDKILEENEFFRKEIDERALFQDIRFRIGNFDAIKDSFDRNAYLFPDSVYTSSIETIYSLEELEVISILGAEDLTEQLYVQSLLSLFSLLKYDTHPAVIKKINNYIEILSSKYQLRLEIESLEARLVHIFGKSSLNQLQTTELYLVQSNINQLKHEISLNENVAGLIDKLDRILSSYEKIEYDEMIESSDKLLIKNFILFDCYIDDDQRMVPYILKDLDESHPDNLVDVSIERDKIQSNGYEDFTALIDDLLLYGQPGILNNHTFFGKRSRIICPVYYTDSKYERVKDTKDNATGMVRIRPKPTSFARFIDEKVEFIPNTEKYRQIVGLLKSIIPGIEIDESKTFGIFINFMSAYKKKDTSIYREAINRHDVSKIADILKTKSSSFTNEELEIIKNVIIISLSAYSSLEQLNEAYDFKVIKKVAENKQIGLH